MGHSSSKHDGKKGQHQRHGASGAGQQGAAAAEAADAAAAAVRLHPLLTDAEVGILEQAQAKIAADERGAQPALCEALGLPERAAAAAFAALGGAADGTLDKRAFLDAVALLIRGTTADMRGQLFKAGVPGAFELAFFAANGDPKADFDAAPLVKGFEEFAQRYAEANSCESTLDVEMFRRWCTADVPSLHEPVLDFVSHKLLHTPTRAGALAGRVSAGSKEKLAESEVLTQGAVFALSCCDARCQGGWDRLFSSNKDGMSFDAMAKSLIGYEGPTVVAVQDADGNVFGALVSETWRECGVFYGQPNSVLFSIKPSFSLRRCRTDGTSAGTDHFQYLKIRGRQGHQGIGFGGDEYTLRLFLDRNFEECRAAKFDLTYDEGPIRPADQPAIFKPNIIECWGLGGDEAAQAQVLEHADIERMQLNRRKVDKKKFVENEFDRQFLLGGTYAHQQQVEDRGGQ